MSTITENAKLIALEEAIKEAIKNGNLDSKMDLFNLQAADIGLSADDLQELISKCRRNAQDSEKVVALLAPHKRLITLAMGGLLILEWVIAFIVGIKGIGTILWVLFINLLSAFVLVFLIACIVRRKGIK